MQLVLCGNFSAGPGAHINIRGLQSSEGLLSQVQRKLEKFVPDASTTKLCSSRYMSSRSFPFRT